MGKEQAVKKSDTTEKKPVYKQWWFWVVVILGLGIIGGAMQTDDEQPTVENKPAEGVATVEQPQTSEDKPATEPSSSQTEGTSSAENAGGYKVGETMVFKDRKVTVTSVERNYSTGSDFTKPEDGKEFVKIDVTITNTTTSKLYVSAGDWKIQDSDGVIDGYDLYATSATKNALDSSVELAGGGRVSGALVFEVPKGDSGLQLQYRASFLNTVVIKL